MTNDEESDTCKVPFQMDNACSCLPASRRHRIIISSLPHRPGRAGLPGLARSEEEYSLHRAHRPMERKAVRAETPTAPPRLPLTTTISRLSGLLLMTIIHKCRPSKLLPVIPRVSARVVAANASAFSFGDHMDVSHGYAVRLCFARLPLASNFQPAGSHGPGAVAHLSAISRVRIPFPCISLTVPYQS